MPGRLMMDDHGASGAESLANGIKKGSNAAESAPAVGGVVSSHQALSGDGKNFTNDTMRTPNTGMSNGVRSHEADASALTLSNGTLLTSSTQASIPNSLTDLPPEIRHITAGYLSLSLLYTRVVQLCINDLKELVEELSKDPSEVHSNGVQLNGASSAAADAAQNAERKHKWMDFAMTHRDRLIKVLVLSQWSRQVKQVSKLIDLRNWMFEKQEYYNFTRAQLFGLATDLNNMKVWNPDIKTALETLSTGSARALPDLGFVPPEPLQPQQTLATLRRLNALLSIRLNLHERIPHYLRDWSLSSGRASFRIPQEFELDVSIADEEPESPFFFIDIRFLFTPAPLLTEGPVWHQIEQLANMRLASDGLSGCFEFFHDFVLTHKINVLRQQAVDLTQGLWSKHLRLEFNRRVLTVQYWSDLPGPKSWLEFGVASGKPKSGRTPWTGLPPSQISVRWHQQGKLVSASELVYDWNDISLERMLRKAVAQHTRRLLSSARQAFLARIRENRDVQIELDETDSAASLNIRIANSNETMSVSISQISGSYVIEPATSHSLTVQTSLNSSNHALEAVLDGLGGCISANIEQRIQRHAENAGWIKLRNIKVKPDAIRAAIPNPGRISWYRGIGWRASEWCMLANARPVGQSFYAVQLANPTTGESIQSSFPLTIAVPGSSSAGIDRIFFQYLERLAIREIGLRTAAKMVTRLNVDSSRQSGQHGKSSASGRSALLVKFSSLLKAAQDLRARKPSKSTRMWAGDVGRLEHRGLDRETGDFIFVFKGILVIDQALLDVMKQIRHPEAVITENGALSLIIRTPFGGDTCIDQLLARINAIDRILSMVDTIKKEELSCTAIGIDSITIRYGHNYNVTLTLTAPATSTSITFSPNNPHARINILLLNVLNASGFQNFIRSLKFSLPIVSALQAIDAQAPHKPRMSLPTISTRAADTYGLDYRPTGLPVYLEVKLRQRWDGYEWQIDDYLKRRAREMRVGFNRPPILTAALEEAFMQSGKGWTGLRTLVCASVEGAEEALMSVHEALCKIPRGEVRGTIQQQAKAQGKEVISLD